MELYCTVWLIGKKEFMWSRIARRWRHYCGCFCVDFSFCCIIKQLVDSLEQNIGFWRQAFIQPTAGLHQVWGRTEMLCLLWVLRGSMSMFRTCKNCMGELGWPECVGKLGWFNWVGVFSLRPNEVQLLAGWKLVFNNLCSVPENLPTA